MELLREVRRQMVAAKSLSKRTQQRSSNSLRRGRAAIEVMLGRMTRPLLAAAAARSQMHRRRWVGRCAPRWRHYIEGWRLGSGCFAMQPALRQSKWKPLIRSAD